MESKLKQELGHIATELQVGRNTDAKGRVDIFFNYRNTSFIIEFKVARIGITGSNNDNDPDNEEPPLIRITKPWKLDSHGVVSQLSDLEIDSIGHAHDKIVKMPIVLYLHVDWRNGEPRDKWQDLSAQTHSRIKSTLEHETPPQFNYYSLLEVPIRTRRRTSDNPMTLYGFTLVASDLK